MTELIQSWYAIPWVHNTLLFILVMSTYLLARRWLDLIITKASVAFIQWPVLQQGFQVRGSEWISAQWLHNAIKNTLRALSIACHFALFFSFVVTMLSLVPETKPPTMQVVFWVSHALWKLTQDFLGFIPNLISILTIIAVAIILIRFLSWIKTNLQTKRIHIPGFYAEWSNPTYNLIRVFVVLATIVMIAPYLPIYDSPAFKGMSIFLGVLVSLGSTSAISNIFAGMVLIYTRSYQAGDVIECDQFFGTVIEKSMLTTRIRTPKNEDVVIPNGKILNTAIINHSENLRPASGLILHTKITIGYDAPWETVHTLLLDAASKTEHVLDTPKAFVLQTKLDDFYVEYELNAYTHRPSRRPAILSELHQRIQDAFRNANMEITSPHYRAHRDGTAPAIPPMPEKTEEAVSRS